MTYRLTGKAAADIRRIYVEGIRLFGAAQAARYHARLERVFGLLADNPELARERTELSPPVRIHPCGSHIVVYVVEADGGILILRVRHGREDWLGSPEDRP
jgi:toxin ParE1/3/4